MAMSTIRNLLMRSVCPTIPYLLDAEKGGKTPAEVAAEQRAAISKTVVNNKEPEEKEENANDDNTENDDDKETSEQTGDDGDGKGDEENEEGDEEGEEKEVEAKDKDTEKLKKTIERLQRRVDKKTGSEATLRKELDLAKKALEAKKTEGDLALTEDEVERRANEKAETKAAERQFTTDCNKLLDDALKVDKKFEIKIKALAEDIGEIPSQMIGILADLDNGGAVLAHLADNDDIAESIWSLPLAKMTLKLVRLSGQLEEAAKPKPKKISQVPAPNEPISGGSKTPVDLKGALAGSNGVITRDKMEAYNKMRARQVEERRLARMGR